MEATVRKIRRRNYPHYKAMYLALKGEMAELKKTNKKVAAMEEAVNLTTADVATVIALIRMILQLIEAILAKEGK